VSDDDVQNNAPVDVNGEVDIPEDAGDGEEVVNGTANIAPATDNVPRAYTSIFDVRHTRLICSATGLNLSSALESHFVG
jgi:hypothetical protein